MKDRPLIYQDQDSLNSARLIVCGAEKCALTAIREPELQEKRRAEAGTTAVLSGVAGGLAALGFLVGVASGSAAAASLAVTSGAGLTTGLSAVGRLIGGIVINPMVSGIFLTVAAPVLIGFGVFFAVRAKVNKSRARRFDEEKLALRQRAVACRDAIQGKLGTTGDSRWEKDLSDQLALVESVIANLDRDTAVKI